jgi:hypothetical protein
MPEIPDPPNRPVCAAHGPLTWLWSARKQAWFSFVGDPSDREVLRLHHCTDTDRLPSWRDDLPPADPERNARGKAMVLAAIAKPNHEQTD